MSRKKGSVVKGAFILLFAIGMLLNTADTAKAVPDQGIRVYLNNQLLAFDVHPVVEKGRILVPMAEIFSSMGAQVRWDGPSQTVTAIRKETAVEIKIGSLHPSVNGKDYPIDVPAKIVKNRTMVPVGFVGEAFGGKVNWDPTKRVVNITLAPSIGQKNEYVSVIDAQVNLRSGPATSYEKVGTASHGQQMEVLAKQGEWYQVNYQGRSVWVAGWLVALNGQASPTSQPLQPVPSPNITTAPELAISCNCDGSGISLNMECLNQLQPTVSENGNEIIYRFSGVSIKENKNYKEKTGRGEVSIQAFNQENAVIVKISVPAGVQHQRRALDNGKKQVFIISNCVLGIERQPFEASGERLIIHTLLTPSCTFGQEGTIISINLPGMSRGVVNNTTTYNSRLLKSVSLEQGANNSTQNLTVKVETQGAVKYCILPGCKNENALFLVMMNPSDFPTPKNTVLLDPGHGGADSGTCPFQVREKDINLSIALKVGAALSSKGIKVYYTRRDDSSVGLAERSAMSNLLNPALFVSIHNNGVEGNPDVNGTETFYYAPQDNQQLYAQKTQRMRIADLIQQKLIMNLGFPDRGVKMNNLAVLRLTLAPCALAEVGFLSNPETGRLMQQPDCQDRAASAIASAISEYLGKSR